MKAAPGDTLIVEGRRGGDSRRMGLIVGVDHADGTPPYRVRWEDSAHESLVFPGPDAHVVHAAEHGARL
ncbi:DUF1918 domain-containing protein [Nonomuraea sediminis]|uniref:DUF1918 domain-containing protein n=1 Tax=Nonomuraea sediminis TaxID=2835864 RepID=UPI001BDC2ABA|nr:DUF1918 domain-containing protein [Nonomuraea sediminis]